MAQPIILTRVIADPEGLHARPVTLIAAAALRWPEETAITVSVGGRAVPARELIKLMRLGARAGEELTFSFEGPDAEAASEGFRELIEGL